MLLVRIEAGSSLKRLVGIHKVAHAVQCHPHHGIVLCTVRCRLCQPVCIRHLTQQPHDLQQVPAQSCSAQLFVG